MMRQEIRTWQSWLEKHKIPGRMHKTVPSALQVDFSQNSRGFLTGGLRLGFSLKTECSGKDGPGAGGLAQQQKCPPGKHEITGLLSGCRVRLFSDCPNWPKFTLQRLFLFCLFVFSSTINKILLLLVLVLTTCLLRTERI